MKFEIFVAKKYFKAKRRTGFISIITYVSIVGITIGVLALIITLSVMNGFENEVRGRLINSNAHLRVRKFHTEPIYKYQEVLDSLKTIPEITGATPTIFKEGVIRSKDSNQGCMIKAVDTTTIRQVYQVDEKMMTGEFDLSPVEVNGRPMPGIILARYLAENLYVFNPGKVVTLFSISENASIMTPPKVKQFYVKGIIELGFYDFDKTLAFVSINDAQAFLDTEGVSWIEANVQDYNQAENVKGIIEEKMGYPFTAFTWFDLNKNLFNWMAIEKWGSFIILSLIIMVAAFNIVSSLIMIVMEKTRDIGILKSMGAESKSIMRIFMFESLIVGLMGAVIGTALGVSVCFIQQKFGIISLPSDVYIISKLPMLMELWDIIAINVAAISLCLLAGVYPAFQASKLNPVEAIRYE